MSGEAVPEPEVGAGVPGSVLKQLVFLPWLQFPPLPRVPDLSDPAKFGLGSSEEGPVVYASHLFISSPLGTKESTSRVGAWLLLPGQSSGKVEPLTADDTIVLYLHGNASNRSQDHRVGLYKLLLSLGYYVLAIDYRGFGDSSPVDDLTENTVVQDARAALGWITSKLGELAKVVVWGHSLGTAIGTRMVADFDLETGGNSSVAGVILEAPFNNMLAEVLTYKAAQALKWAGVNVEQILLGAGLTFDADKWLPAIRCPVLILHSEDDKVVPYNLGQELFTSAKDAGKSNIRFVTFPGDVGLGHNDIYLADCLKEEVDMFVNQLVLPIADMKIAESDININSH